MLCTLQILNDNYSLFSIGIQYIHLDHHNGIDTPPVFSLPNSCQHSGWNLWEYNTPLNVCRATIPLKVGRNTFPMFD